MPTERPILFSAPMVRAIIDGRKTQTRRVLTEGTLWRHTGVTPAPEHGPFYLDEDARLNCKYITASESMFRDGMNRCAVLVDPGKLVRCPYGKPGDRLWVRETFTCLGNEDGHPVNDAGELCKYGPDAAIRYRADVVPAPYGLERLPEGGDYDGTWKPSIFMPRWASRITLEITDVRVERLQDISEEDAKAEGAGSGPHWDVLPACGYHVAFRSLWESINGEGAWDKNPWVWAISFKRVEV